MFQSRINIWTLFIANSSFVFLIYISHCSVSDFTRIGHEVTVWDEGVQSESLHQSQWQDPSLREKNSSESGSQLTSVKTAIHHSAF